MNCTKLLKVSPPERSTLQFLNDDLSFMILMNDMLQHFKQNIYEGCPKSKCPDFLFKCLLDSPEITSYLLQSMTLGNLHSGSNIFSTDHSSTGSHFP